ncbi:SH3 domain-containing protein [Streptomyces sp. NPDC049967]|uniref:SH3 domain-containing protein n=1 Tax=unclassified Streptomyces TaxID=2593676 RepID=UPI00093E1520|nr:MULTISPECIES: SH3 domain-containing protein [unclassified Streptomyces]OKK18677.1 ligand-binding protein SH3 [Streptomyces sp. CB02488]WRZ11151.1 SH3 domain-containing protein [Streptomyces sp. NBC_00341]WSJ22196.1 SH3 domain-containing protein [Streptomyces sp. NBC_01324]
MRNSIKVISVTGVAVLGALGTAVAPANAAAQSVTAKAAASCYIHNVSGSTLNVRSGPGAKYTLLGTIAAGGKLSCGTDQDSVTKGQSYTSCGGGNGWMTVRINGRDGWVAEECVAVGAA